MFMSTLVTVISGRRKWLQLIRLSMSKPMSSCHMQEAIGKRSLSASTSHVFLHQVWLGLVQSRRYRNTVVFTMHYSIPCPNRFLSGTNPLDLEQRSLLVLESYCKCNALCHGNPGRQHWFYFYSSEFSNSRENHKCPINFELSHCTSWVRINYGS